MQYRVALTLATIVSLASSFVIPASADARIPLDYKAYDSWNAIHDASFSANGQWFAYSLVPEDADGAIVARNEKTGQTLREERGSAPVFAGNDRYVVYTVAAPHDEIDAARRANKRPDQFPKSALGILDLNAGTAVTIPRVRGYHVARHSAHWIAYQLENDDTAKTQPAPAASPSASPSPLPENKKKTAGYRLELRNLDSGDTLEIPDVTEYAFSADEKFLAYSVEHQHAANDGVYVRDLAAGTTAAVAAGEGRYTQLTFAAGADELAFLSDASSYASPAPHPDLMTWTPAQTSARIVVDASTAGLPRGFVPDADGTVAFNHDGSLLYLGTNVAPTPLPSNTPPPMGVDLWNWRDARLQSEQRTESDADAKRSYRAVVHVSDGRFVQLASSEMQRVVANDSADAALVADPSPYYREMSWDDSYADYYLVSLLDGHKKLAGRHMHEACTLSPAGKYALCYDTNARSWYTIRATDGRRVDLTKGLHVAFYDELDDHPAAPPPYGAVGWTDGDRRVLVSDRYDIWSFNPDGGIAQMLTRGYGRAHKMRFTYAPMDPERAAIPSTGTLYLLALDDLTKASGIFSLPSVDGGVPKALFVQPQTFGMPIKAKDADLFAFTRSSFHEFPDYWIADGSFAHPQRATDANPQMAKYRWGTEHLIHYVADGKHLDGIVYLPDGFDPHKKYPMLVYIYERFSDELHRFYMPQPGTSPNFPRYVSNGYVLLIPDIAYGTGHPGRDALHAVSAAIDTVAARGYIDTKHIGIAGHSWGAYQIAYMITKTHRFAAAEAGAAVANMTSAFGGIRWGSGLVRDFQYEHGQSRLGTTPWENPQLYLDNSALFSVQNVRTPYLTIANDNDDAVPWYQGIEFFTALRRLNKEAYMFSFNGEYHNLHGREQQKYWTVHLDEYFDHFLKGTPEPEWMLSGVPYLHRGERDVRPLYGEKP